MAETVQIKLVRKSFFFDSPELIKRIGKAKARTMNRTGATIRQIARRSMKKAPQRRTKAGKLKNLTQYGRYQKIKSGKRKGQQRFQKGFASPPGKPPYYHGSAQKNLRSIIYQYDPKADRVDVFTQPTGSKSKNVPTLQEAGGSAKIKQPGGKVVSGSFPSRPYLAPAGKAGIEYLQKAIKDSIT
jgi:hypothetical protein